MADFFVSKGLLHRAANYPNGIRVTYPDGKQKWFKTAEDFENEFPDWAAGIDEKTSKCLSFLWNTFKGMKYARSTFGSERARIDRAKQLGGRICECPAGNGVGSVYVSGSRPGVVYVQLGANVKGKGRYAICAEFWTGNLIEMI